MSLRGGKFCQTSIAIMAAVGAVTVWSPAHAQGVARQQTSIADGNTSEADHSANGTARNELPDIIVTARRSPEHLQRVPVSVVAITGEELESRSVTNLRSLQNFVPNLTLAASQNVGEAAGNAFIRGIGQEDFAIGAESGVGFYVDGVYFARSTGTLMNLIDVARIEVLRGPQGTLFGKNTIGGAISLVSVKPQPEREGRSSLILGNYQRVEWRAVLNLPLSDDTFVRVSAGIVSRDGYLRRLPPPLALGALGLVSKAPINLEPEGDDRSQGVRVQLRRLFSDTLTADLSLDVSRRRNTQGATHIDSIDPRFGVFRQLNRLIRVGKLPGTEITSEFPPANLLASYASGRNLADQDLWGISTVLTKTIGGSTLKFIAAYRGLRSHTGTDLDGTYFSILESDISVEQRQFSGELQLTGANSALSYVAGLFLFRERSKLLPLGTIQNEVLYTCGCFFTADNQPQFTRPRLSLGSDSYAGYAQGAYRLSDRLSVTLGARYSYEKKSIVGEAFGLDSNLQPTQSIVGTGTNRDSWSSFTFRAGAELQVRKNLMVYGSIARGFKSGGFNSRAAINLPNLGFAAYKPETALTYELGLRSEWFDRRLRFNATLFRTDYENIQLRQQTIAAGTVTTSIENAAKARIRGAEVELVAVPIGGLTLSAVYGHLDARYLDVGQVAGLTLASRFQRSPSHSFSASIDYKTPVRWGTLEMHLDYSYRSKEQFQITAAPNDQAAYGLLGARLTLRTKQDRFSVALFGSNLADQHFRTAGRNSLINQTGIAYSSIGMPRQFGIQVTSRF